MVGGKGFGDDHPTTGGDRGGRWIDDQEQLHNGRDRSGGSASMGWRMSRGELLL
jgi:hypothetical protein